MKTSLQIAFYLKKDKVRPDHTAPIYVRLTLRSVITSFSSGFYIVPERWESTKQLKLARKEADLQIRNEILQMRGRIMTIMNKLQADGKIVSAKTLKLILLDPDYEKRNKNHTLLALFELHNKRFLQKVEAEIRSKASFVKYTSAQGHIISFIKAVYKVDDMEVAQLNFDFIEQFDNYLRKNEGLANNTTVKYCQFLQAMIRNAIKHHWIVLDPFIKYDGELQEVKTNVLTHEQIDTIANKDFGCERLNVVRDVFIFGCYTGYAPVDISQLTPDHVQTHIDGQKWIFKNRQKTDVTSNVPLLQEAMEIIERYKDHPLCLVKNRLLPYSTNQTINAYLKEIGDICKIPFSLHFYVSRHTFATTISLGNGGSMESTSKMLGHLRISQTQHYGKVANERVGEEMKKVQARLNDRKKKNDDDSQKKTG